MIITNFPVRYAFTNPDGTLTTEAARMLRGWFARIGGETGISAADLELINAFTVFPATNTSTPDPVDYSAEIAYLRQCIDQLQNRMDFVTPPTQQQDVYGSIF